MQAADPGETGRREQKDPFKDHTAGALSTATGHISGEWPCINGLLTSSNVLTVAAC
jgi:hypothetical protein